MNKVQIKRLLNVARALREAHAAKKKFDMSKWVFGDSGAVESAYDNEKGCLTFLNTEKNFCGTPACALGHYAARTDLQRVLKVSIIKDHRGVPLASMDAFGEKPGTGVRWEDDRVLAHFGISSDEYFELFDGDGCGHAKTALQAAKYIERFVKRKQHPGRFIPSEVW